MKLKLEMSMVTQSFMIIPEEGENGLYNLSTDEMRTVLNKMVLTIEDDLLVGGNLVDSNGNTVGNWTIED